ncbi:Uncharacterised protein [uncultured archaeon]|nr:Uncharacterised protein [uncultured archaeon]
MRNLMVLVILLALCVTAMAQTENKTAMPDMVGKWTGVLDVVVWEKNTAWMPNETVSYWPDTEYTITITEQKGNMFSGEIVPTLSPRSKEIIIGVFSSDNESIAMADENDYLWGYMNSPPELELFSQKVNIEGMEVKSGIFKKV